MRPDDAEPPGLRAIAPGDARQLHAIHEAAFKTVGGYEPQSEAAWTQREFRAPATDLALSRVAERDHAPAGFALAQRWADGIVYVALLAVHPDAAGQGLGGELLRGVFAAAAAAGQRQVQLNVAADNPNAVRLYERVGMAQRWRYDEYRTPLPD